MYKALNYWVFGGFDGSRTPFEFIDWAAAAGLDGVELTVGDCLKPDIAEHECRAIAEYARKKGVGLRTLASVAGWSCALGASDETERQAAIAFTRRYLQIAAWIGAETVLVVPGATRIPWEPDRPTLGYQQVWEATTASVRELVPFAEEVGVNLALENVWNRFLLSPMEWQCFLDQFDSERVGMYFDTGNACIYARPQDYPEILGGRIKAVHLKTFTETEGGMHGFFGDDLTAGSVDFHAVFQAMDNIEYTGPYTVEMIPNCPGVSVPDSELAQRTAQALLRLAGG